MKFYDYDIVKAARDIREDVPKGTEGTIVMIYYSDNYRGNEHEGYEVEFFDENDDTIDCVTVNAEDIELIKRYYKHE